MRSLFTFFTKRHLLANVLTVALIILGTRSLLTINREEFPNIISGLVSVNTIYRGASPEDVELNVTNKIEDSLKDVSDISSFDSTSMENKSTVSIEIEEGADEDKVYNDIIDAVNRVSDLPVDAEQPVIAMRTPNRVAMSIGISSKVFSYKDLRKYARSIEKKIMDLPLVGSITLSGSRDREIRIEVSLDKMVGFGVSLNEIKNAINSRNIRSSGGSLESYTDQKNVITLSRFTTPGEVKNVIIKSNSEGSIIYLKDVADIYDDFVTQTELYRVNGVSTITMEIGKKDSADIIRAADSIKKLIDEEKKGVADVKFLIIKDGSKTVSDKFEIVKTNGLIGLLLVLVVLALFLSIHASFWVAMGIPVSLLGVITLLPFFNVELDSLTLAAMVIVIGIIVDDAIVIVENIFRHYEEGKEPLQAAIDGTVEVGLPVFTTVATTILAFLPMFFIKGILGKFIYVVPLTVVLSLIVSMLEAFFILPAHILKGLKKNKQKDAGKNWFVPFRNAFEFLLKDVLKFRYASLFIAMFLLVVSLGYAKNFIKFKLFDRSRVVDSIDISLEMPIGTSLMATSAKGLEFEAILKKFPKTEISSYYMKVGRGGTRGSTGTHLATLTLYPASDKILSRSINEITYDLNTKFTKVKGVKKLTIGTTTRGPKMGRPLEVMIKGSQGGSRNRVIIEVMEFLNNINGISGMDIDTKAGKEEIVIIPNYTLLARYGLKVSDLAQTVRLAYDGEIATVNRYGDEDVDFRVIMQKTFRENIEQLKLLKVPDSKGNLIDLGEIADFSIRPGVYAIYHENGESAVTISADINQKMVTSIEVIKKIKAHFDYEYMKKYSGIRIDIGGEAKNTRQMLIDMGISFLMAVIGIYALLMLQFNSLAQPLIVMLAIPFGLTGVILAYGLQGFMTMSMFAGIGVIGLIGVVVNDSLVMVDHLNSIKKSSGLDDSVSFIAKGAANRLRPVLVTTVTTVAGLLPLAYGIGGKDPMMADMAMSMGWGLLFATPVTLLILPCLYMIGEDLGNIFNRKSEEK